MFRYYGWLPVELEPEYKDGFTCDKCGEDFLDGPLYHRDDTGMDYCLRCGENDGLSPFNGLVSSLLFSDTGEVLRDATTGSFVTFGYQVHSERFGLHFSDGSNIGVQLSPAKSIVSVNCWPSPSVAANTRLQKRPFDVPAWQERFPWLCGQMFWQSFSLVVRMHEPAPSDSLPVSAELYITKHDHTESCFSLCLGGGWQQVFDSENGVEIVAKNGHIVALFHPQDATTHVWGKKEAQELYDEMVTMLNDKP